MNFFKDLLKDSVARESLSGVLIQGEKGEVDVQRPAYRARMSLAVHLDKLTSGRVYPRLVASGSPAAATG